MSAKRPRQYVDITFRPGGRSYRYHNDGEPVAAGDKVRVAQRNDDGWQAVDVIRVDHVAPGFKTNPILGLHAKKEKTE
jgi:hypothetical protein